MTHLIKRWTDIDGEVIFESLNGKDGYYINAGSDRHSYGLILCHSKKGCITGYVSNFGYYIPENEMGIILCSENTKCKLQKEVSNYYINAGYQRKKYPLIYCSNGKCEGSVQVDGYYLMHIHSTLIKCVNHQCGIILARIGYYLNAENKKYNIMCIRFNANISCGRRLANPGIYISAVPDVLLNCMSEYCQEDELHDGIYRASTTYDLVLNGSQRDNSNTRTMYNLISCKNNICKELSSLELRNFPICSYFNNICFYQPLQSSEKNTKNYLSPGEYCTNDNHSILFLVTGIVPLKEDSNLMNLPNEKNCISATNKYSDNFFYISNKLYMINEGKIAEINKMGIYFINTAYNTLVKSNNIEDYNDRYIKIFYCNGNYCKPWEKPEVVTYFSNTFNKIFKYDPYYDKISFAYEYDLKCTYNSNNYCVIDEKDEEKIKEIDDREFCVTNDGELVLILLSKDETKESLSLHQHQNQRQYRHFNDTKIIRATSNENSYISSSKETTTKNNRTYIKNEDNFLVECMKAKNDDEPIYGLAKHFYKLDLKSAKIISNSGHYIVNSSTNKAINNKDFKKINKSIKIYNCIRGNCEPNSHPSSNYFYYDNISQLMVKYRNNNRTWELLNNSGYVYTSVNPNYVSVFQYNTLQNHINISSIQAEGDYYTLDNQLFTCTKGNEAIYNCVPISKPNYYFTVNGFILNCEINDYDDEIYDEIYNENDNGMEDTNKIDNDKKENDIDDNGKEKEIDNKIGSDIIKGKEKEKNEYEDNNDINELETNRKRKNNKKKRQLNKYKCKRMKCNLNELYSIYDAYYRCTSNDTLLKINNNQCSFNEKVIINYPTMFSNAMDEDVYRQVLNSDSLQEKYHIKTKASKKEKSNLIHSIHGVFTNCTYDNEVKVFNYDLICAEDQLLVNLSTKVIEICSKIDFGFVQCIAEDNNPDKCNPNSFQIIHPSFLKLLISIISISLIYIY